MRRRYDLPAVAERRQRRPLRIFGSMERPFLDLDEQMVRPGFAIRGSIRAFFSQRAHDLSSSYFEGIACPLAALGHNRDGKKGKLQVNYRLLTDARGCPVSVSVFEGNTGDSTTVLPQLRNVRDRFGIKNFVAIGDRCMISRFARSTITWRSACARMEASTFDVITTPSA